MFSAGVSFLCFWYDNHEWQIGLVHLTGHEAGIIYITDKFNCTSEQLPRKNGFFMATRIITNACNLCDHCVCLCVCVCYLVQYM